MKKNLIGLLFVIGFSIQGFQAQAQTGRTRKPYAPKPVARILDSEGDEESPWYLFLGGDLGISNYSPYNNSQTETARSGLHLGVRALVAHYSDSFVIDGGLGWQYISNSGTNADGTKNTDSSQVPYFDFSPRYRFGNTNFQIGPELQYWFSTDKGLNPTLPGRDTISDDSNTSTWLGIQGMWEWTSGNKYRFGGRFLHGMGINGRSVNVFQAFFQIGFDAFGSHEETDRRNHDEQVIENDLSQAERYEPKAPLPMATPEPTPMEELNPDPVVMSTPAPVEPEPIPDFTPETQPEAAPLGAAVPAPKVMFTLDVNDLPFGFDNANLPKSNASRVKNIGVFLAKHDQSWKKLIISGHTDERGTKAYNVKLSKNRAETVKRLLVSGGAKASKISTIGMGPSRPKDRKHNEKAWARNRRVELEFKGVKDLKIIQKAMSQ